MSSLVACVGEHQQKACTDERKLPAFDLRSRHARLVGGDETDRRLFVGSPLQLLLGVAAALSVSHRPMDSSRKDQHTHVRFIRCQRPDMAGCPCMLTMCHLRCMKHYVELSPVHINTLKTHAVGHCSYRLTCWHVAGPDRF